MTEPIPTTVRWADVVYGSEGAALDDLAETFHEASNAYPSSAARQARGVQRLAESPELRASAARAVRRHVQAPRVALPAPHLPHAPLSSLVSRRRSQREFCDSPIGLDALSALLHAGYGVTRHGSQPLRSVPSGGALYPLELYVLASRVTALEAGLYHFDPLAADLEVVQRELDVGRLLAAMIYRDPVEQAAVVLLLTAMFWRTRFKYALRGYRFALLEAGHVAQNLLLCAHGLGLAGVPLGGFYDRQVASFLSVDGVNEAPLYVVCFGRPT
jgi:SagB-type dehydrogenase family enzyme